MDREVTQSRTRRITGSLLIALPGLALAGSAIVKFAHVPGVVSQMAALGFSDGKLTLVATLEIVSALLFLFSRTRSLGVLMLSAFLGGVICTHVRFGDYTKAMAPSVLLFLAWMGTWLRHPQVLWSPDAPGPTTSRPAENRGRGLASRIV
jgi:DoxX-like family